MSEPPPIVAVAISAALVPCLRGGPLQTVFDAIEERQRFRAEQTAREIGQLVGEDALVARLADNPELETVLAQALTAATLTGLEAKRKLLAGASSRGLLKRREGGSRHFGCARAGPARARAYSRVGKVGWKSPTGIEKPGMKERRRSSKPRKMSRFLSRPRSYGQAWRSPPRRYWGVVVRVYDVSDFGRELLRQLKEVADEDSERVGH